MDSSPGWTFPSDESLLLLKDLLRPAVRQGHNNVLAMQWPDVHLERKHWQIAITKNGEPQTVRRTPKAIEILERRKMAAQGSQTPFVFTGSDETGHLVEPRGAWERMLARSTALGLMKALAEKATVKRSTMRRAGEQSHHRQRMIEIRITWIKVMQILN